MLLKIGASAHDISFEEKKIVLGEKKIIAQAAVIMQYKVTGIFLHHVIS